MRRLLHIFLFVTLLGFVLSGCRQSAAERRLVAADTLIAHGDYDSALAQLRAVDTAALSRDELAYHGLLMAHAAYKAYDSAYLDTTWIARARTAYADGGPYDRHIRTMLYSGCVAEDLGDPLTAMRWYKRTELEAQPEDHFHKGYTLMRMGVLYQSQNTIDTVDITHYKQALSHFIAIADTNYQIVCLTELGSSLTRTQIDSAKIFIKKAIHLSKGVDDFFYYTNLVDLAWLYLTEGNYRQAINIATDAFENGTDYNNPEWCGLILAYSYANLNNIDSASYYLPQSTKQLKNEHKVYYFQTLAQIDYFHADSLNYYRHLSYAYQQANQILDTSLPGRINSSENQFEILVSKQKLMESQLKTTIWIAVSITILLVSLLIIAAVLYRRKLDFNKSMMQVVLLKDQLQDMNLSLQEQQDTFDKLRSESEKRIRFLQDEISSAQSELSQAQTGTNNIVAQLKTSKQQLKQAVSEKNILFATFGDFCSMLSNQIDIMSKIATKAQVLKENPKLFLHQTKEIISNNDNQLWLRIRVLASHLHPGVMEYIVSNHPNLSQREQQLILLTIFGLLPDAIAGCMGWSSKDMVYKHKNNLKNKMGLETTLNKYVAHVKQDLEKT